MEKLFGKTLAQIEQITNELKMPKFRAGQISQWLYKKHVYSVEEMTNLSKQNREDISARFEVGCSLPVQVTESADGTKKYLFQAQKGKFIESAYIPESYRSTLCVSSQVGCKMGCVFCATGKQGFQGQLSAGEIINQVRSIPERDSLTNIVYMGMGEPFDNLDQVLQSIEILTSDWGFAWSPRRITVSTIGILPALKSFLEKSQANLAISLHSPFEEERAQLMPIQSRYSVKDIVSVVRNFDFGRQRRLSFEYIMFKGINDTPKHITELARLLNGIRCRVNLIRFHELPGVSLKTSDDETIEKFKNALNDKRILTTIRTSRGQDINAACGLLATTRMKETLE